jgi:hypothetical protein
MNFPVGYMECWALTKHEAKIFSLAFTCVDVARVLTTLQLSPKLPLFSPERWHTY